MRGKPALMLARVMIDRNIPAHAGKTTITQLFAKDIKEHPRACGENLLVLVILVTSAGTSPRMRGKL